MISRDSSRSGTGAESSVVNCPVSEFPWSAVAAVAALREFGVLPWDQIATVLVPLGSSHPIWV